MVIDPLVAAEIIAWWSSQRHSVDTACKNEAAAISAKAAARIDALSTRELFLPSKARRDLEACARSEIDAFRDRIARELDNELALSLGRIEGIAEFDVDSREAALIALGGLLGTGSIGLAVAATSVATTSVPTTVFFGLIATGSLTMISWPVFATAAVGATALAVVSPTVAKGGSEMLRRRYKRHIESQVENHLVQGSRGTNSVREDLLAALDSARVARMKVTS